MYFFITYVSKMSNAEGVSEKFFRHPLKITLPPLEEILKTPLHCIPCSLFFFSTIRSQSFNPPSVKNLLYHLSTSRKSPKDTQ